MLGAREKALGMKPCIIVCYSVYFWLIRSFTDPAFTGSIFVFDPLHYYVLLPGNELEVAFVHETWHPKRVWDGWGIMSDL